MKEIGRAVAKVWVLVCALLIATCLCAGCRQSPQQPTIPSDESASTTPASTAFGLPSYTGTSAAAFDYSTSPSGDSGAAPPENMAQPAVGVPFTDPIFKTHVVRITDARATGQKGLCPDYSKRQAWNSDDSLLLLRSADGLFLLYNGNTYKYIRTLDPIGGEDVLWHPSDPTLLLYNPAHELRAFNVKTGEDYCIFEFAGFEFANTRGEGNLSRDSAWYAVVCSTYDTSNGNVQPVKVVLLSLTQAQGKITGKVAGSMDFPGSVQDLDWVSVSPSGKYIVVDYADDTTGRYHGVEVYDRNFNFLWQKPLGWGHSDLTIDANGDDCLVMDVYNPDSNTTMYMKYRLSDGEATKLLETSALFYDHISCRNTEQVGWVIISTYDNVGRLTVSPDSWLPFENEIFALKLDGSGETRGLAHHHSRRFSPTTPDSDTSVYWAEPHATVGQRGDRILFGSNWGIDVEQTNSVDAYVVDLR